MNCTTNRVTKFSPLEFLIEKEARPLGMVCVNKESDVDLDDVKARAKDNIEKNAMHDKNRVESSKAKILKHKVGDYVVEV